MPIEGLTKQQSDFIERFLKVPMIGKRKKMKERRREAAEQFRLFNAEHDLIREEIAAVEDAAVRSILLGQLAVAETIIEKDPENLDFEGGHKQLEDVQAAMLLHMRKQDAERAHGQLETAMARMDKDNPLVAQDSDADGQSDIALTWAYIEEKFAAGMASNDPKALDDALRAMGRLEVMMRNADKAGQNPFEARLAEVGDARAAAEEGLDPRVQDARRKLSDTFNQLAALREKLAAQFGEDKVPLSLRIGVTTTQKKLDAAVNAAPAKLPDLADDAEAGYIEVQRDAARMIAASQAWVRDHEAFLVRYAVMQAHPKKGDTEFVKPEFDQITSAYLAAKAKADAHDYLEASQDIAVVRNDLKDALDFADDCASYEAVLTEREALLATLPAPAKYPLDKLREDHQAARKLLDDAKDARREKRMSGAMTLLNQIPAAVAEIIELNQMASEFARFKRRWGRRQEEFEDNYDDDVKALISKDVEYCQKAGEAAQADADRGAYKSAAGQIRKVSGYQRKVKDNADYAKLYIAERAAFAARLKETEERAGPEGRVAIESYYQALLGDETKRAGAEATGDIKLANAMCLRLKPQHDEMMKLADDAKDYLVKKAAFDTELAKLKGKKSAEALEARQTAETMLTNAVAATTRGNWLAGTSLLEGATLEIKRAVSDAETAELIDGMQSGEDGIVLTTNSDFKTIYAEFAQVHAHVAELDARNMFAAALEAADKMARSAEGMMPGDLQQAQDTLNQAIQDCKDIALRITAAASYDAQRNMTDRLITQAEDVNEDKVIDDEIRDAKQAQKDAADAAQEPLLDFSGAVRHLAEAQAKARLGLDAMALFSTSIKDARSKIEAQLAKFRAPNVAGHMAAVADRLQAVLDQMNTAFDDRNLTEAGNHARKGVELVAAFEETFKEYEQAEAFIKQYVRGKQGVEMTHASTTEEASEITRLTAKMDEAHAKGNFGEFLPHGYSDLPSGLLGTEESREL